MSRRTRKVGTTLGISRETKKLSIAQGQKIIIPPAQLPMNIVGVSQAGYVQ